MVAGSPRPAFAVATASYGTWRAGAATGRSGALRPGGHPLAFSPDGRLLATAGEDGAVRLWDLAMGTELRRVGESSDRLTGVAFSPDGRLLAATGTDADIRLRDLGEILKSRASRGRRAGRAAGWSGHLRRSPAVPRRKAPGALVTYGRHRISWH